MSRLPCLNSIVTLFVLIIALLTGCSGNKSGETNRLREEFLDGCGNQACWHGVRPGLTSAGDALKALEKADVTYDYLGDPQLDAVWNYTWTPNDENASYGDANMNVANGIVEQSAFSMIVCPADIINAFGDPDLVDGGDNSYGLWYNDELMMVVVYVTETFPQLGALYMFSAEAYSEYTADILPIQISWKDVKDILVQECDG